MADNFTQKEMLVRMMDKMDMFEENVYNKIDEQTKSINATHELASNTNGKVKLHTKIIYGLCGIIVTLIGWILSTGLK